MREYVCGGNSYGLKEMKPTKEHRLVGEGLSDHQMAGVITGGGKWPGRYHTTYMYWHSWHILTIFAGC